MAVWMLKVYLSFLIYRNKLEISNFNQQSHMIKLREKKIES